MQREWLHVLLPLAGDMRRAVWLLGSVAALVLAWWLLRSKTEHEHEDEHEHDQAPRIAIYPLHAPVSTPAPVEIDPLASPQGPPAAQYPPGSQPLTEGSDPATAPPEDDPIDES